MEHADTLSHLLQIESKASALVRDAEDEADMRIREGTEKERLKYEERYKNEVQMQEALYQEANEKVKKQYKDSLNEYHEKISNVNVNKEKFASLLNEYLASDNLENK